MKIVEIKDIEPLKVNHPHLNTLVKAFVVNDLYHVYISKTGQYTHIRIRRIDDKPICNYVDFQEIKNQFLGDEAEAIQVFPKVSNYVDNTNTYHLFSWPEMRCPNLKELYKYI